jgi:hypothetical protein
MESAAQKGLRVGILFLYRRRTTAQFARMVPVVSLFRVNVRAVLIQNKISGGTAL